MKRFISTDKLSKKEQKKLNAVGRGSWNGVRPFTRAADTDKRRYRRKPKHTANMYDAE